jgi:hypothetical protein
VAAAFAEELGVPADSLAARISAEATAVAPLEANARGARLRARGVEAAVEN